jgi:hypothetical protein
MAPERATRHPRLALMGARICQRAPPRGLNRDVHHPADLPVSVPSSLITHCQWCRNINRLSIGYASRLSLRHRLTLSRLPLPRNPETFGDTVSHRVSRYSCLHKRFAALQLSLSVSLRCTENAPLPINIAINPVASAVCLAPVHFRRRATRPVSCYAFFKGWLLLSQPPGCLGHFTSFPTEQTLGGLS